MQRLYHWTPRHNVESIFESGFSDTTYREPKGVHLSADPREYWHAFTDVCVVVELPEDLDIEQWRDRPHWRE